MAKDSADKPTATATKALESVAEKVSDKQPAIGKLPVFLAGAGLGLLAAYMLDPEHGQKRRAKLRDEGAGHIDRGWRALAHKVAAALHEFTHRSTPTTPREMLDKAKDAVEDTVSH